LNKVGKEIKLNYSWSEDKPEGLYYIPRDRAYILNENQSLKNEVFGYKDILVTDSPVFNASWSPCNVFICTAHENGILNVWLAQQTILKYSVQAHDMLINSIN